MAEVIEIARHTLHDQVVVRLRAMLVEGRIVPGAKLNERELCERLGVSRTPLREAIKLLAAEGLIDLLPHRGAVAVKLGELDVRNVFELLAELEGISGELAARRVSDAEIAEIKALHYEMLACFARRDLPGYYRINALIHAAINLAARNPVLTKVYRETNARVQSLRFQTNQNEAKWKLAVGEHEQMIRALEAHDGAALRSILVAHLLAKRDAVLEQLRAKVALPG
jgi:DNA-binding GntR family transcriptional regulator